MPPKTKSNKSTRTRKRSYKKRSIRRGNLTSSYLNPTSDFSVFATQYPFKGEWVDTNGVGSAAAVGQVGSTIRTYNLNSIREPLSGNLTHAMLGKDELSELYRSYKVHGVKIDITFYDPATDGMACVMYLQNPEQTYSIVTKEIYKLEEKGGCDVIYLNNSGSQKKRIVKYLPMYKLCGVTKLQHESNTEDFHGDMGGNPAKMPKLHIGVANMAGNTSETCNFVVRLTFYGKAYEKRTLTASDNS